MKNYMTQILIEIQWWETAESHYDTNTSVNEDDDEQ